MFDVTPVGEGCSARRSRRDTCPSRRTPRRHTPSSTRRTVPSGGGASRATARDDGFHPSVRVTSSAAACRGPRDGGPLEVAGPHDPHTTTTGGDRRGPRPSWSASVSRRSASPQVSAPSDGLSGLHVDGELLQLRLVRTGVVPAEEQLPAGGQDGADLGRCTAAVASVRGGEFWPDRKSTRLNSSHSGESRMPSSA